MNRYSSYLRVDTDAVGALLVVAILGVGLRTTAVYAAQDEVHEMFMAGRLALLASLVGCWAILRSGYRDAAVTIGVLCTAVFVVALTLRSGSLAGEPFILLVAFLIICSTAAPARLARLTILAICAWVVIAALLIGTDVVPGREFISEPTLAGSFSHALAIVFLGIYSGAAMRHTDRLASDLDHSTAELEAMMSHAPVGIATLATDGQILHTNIALRQMVILPEEALAGHQFDALTHGDKNAPLYEAIRRTLAGEHVSSPSTVRFDQPGGEVLQLQVNVAVVDRVEAQSFVMLTFEDVTEVRMLERDREINQTSRRLGLLAGGIAHDFNNVLAAVQAHAMVAKEHQRRGIEADENLERVIEGTEHAALLTQQLLAYAGNDQNTVEPVDLNAVIDDAVELIRPSLPGIKLVSDLADGQALVAGDETRLRQVVMNLMINGSKATSDQGKVRLVTSAYTVEESNRSDWAIGVDMLKDGTYVQLEVQDNGRGISTQPVEKIFDPFYSTNPEGHGLGLAVVLDIVRSHGGAMRVRSEIDQGTSVSVLLPSVQPAA